MSGRVPCTPKMVDKGIPAPAMLLSPGSFKRKKSIFLLVIRGCRGIIFIALICLGSGRVISC